MMAATAINDAREVIGANICSIATTSYLWTIESGIQELEGQMLMLRCDPIFHTKATPPRPLEAMVIGRIGKIALLKVRL
jgi:hypothetical protein